MAKHIRTFDTGLLTWSYVRRLQHENRADGRHRFRCDECKMVDSIEVAERSGDRQLCSYCYHERQVR